MSSLVALFKSIPVVVGLINQFVEMWLTYQGAAIDEKYDDRISQRAALTTALKVAKNDEERKSIARLLHRLNSSI